MKTKTKRFSKSKERFWKRIPKNVERSDGENPKHLFSCIVTDHKTRKRLMVNHLAGEYFVTVAEKMQL